MPSNNPLYPAFYYILPLPTYSATDTLALATNIAFTDDTALYNIRLTAGQIMRGRVPRNDYFKPDTCDLSHPLLSVIPSENISAGGINSLTYPISDSGDNLLTHFINYLSRIYSSDADNILTQHSADALAYQALCKALLSNTLAHLCAYPVHDTSHDCAHSNFDHITSPAFTDPDYLTKTAGKLTPYLL